MDRATNNQRNQDVTDITVITSFMTRAKADPRISPLHLGLFLALLHCWHEQACINPIYIFARDLMPLTKMSSTTTYHRTIRELHAYGYIRYVPSFNPVLGSLVYLQ
jgi:hypothetical protein